MNYIMVFTGFSNINDTMYKYRVEYSWGEERGENFYLVMSSGWFQEFVFDVRRSHRQDVYNVHNAHICLEFTMSCLVYRVL